MNPVQRRKGGHGHLRTLQLPRVNDHEVGVPALVGWSFLNMNYEVAQAGVKVLNMICEVAQVGLRAMGMQVLQYADWRYCCDALPQEKRMKAGLSV